MGDFGTGFLVFIYNCSLKSTGQLLIRVKHVFLVPMALIVVVIGFVQFIEWFAPACVNIDIGLDGIINKLQCSVFHVKIGYEEGNFICDNLNS